MASENLSFIIGIIIFLATLLLIARLIAIKANRDPIMRQYSPDDPIYDVYKRIQEPHRFALTLGLAILFALLVAMLVVSLGFSIAKHGTATSRFILVFGPIIAVATTALSAAMTYNMLIKKK